MDYNMLQKSELKITNIRLSHANLHQIADCVAEMYGVAREKVLVIDVRNEEVCLDILDDHLDPHSFMSREKELLEKVAQIPGVELGKQARITSDGMLGWIAFDSTPEAVDESLARTEKMVQNITECISKRVIVFPSGTEVEAGEIEDTNTPMLAHALQDAGFAVKVGRILKDDIDDIIGQILIALGKGYGTIITTGGVGAEDKDHTPLSVSSPPTMPALVSVVLCSTVSWWP